MSYALSRMTDDRNRVSGVFVNGALNAARSYDTEGRMAVLSNAAFTVTYRFDSDGYSSGYDLVTGGGMTLGRRVYRDPYRRAAVTAVTNSVNGSGISGFVFTHDQLGRVTTRNGDAFAYNARSEITNAVISTNTAAYAYDSIGNRASAAFSAPSREEAYAANSLNQYTNIVRDSGGAQAVTYDADGNMLADGRFAYAWDAENQLIAVYSNSVCIVSNVYDHAHRRVQKITPSAEHTFVYDGWNLLRETIVRDSGETNILNYVWGSDLSGSEQGAGGVGGLVALSINGAFYFPCYDNNGNIIAYVDESGSVAAQFAYDAFGTPLATSNSELATLLSFRFSTKYLDPETGFYYYGYRYYDPDLGRWLTRDPLEEQGGLNLYGFCGNDAVNKWDNMGLKIEYQILRDYISVSESEMLYISSGEFTRGLTQLQPQRHVEIYCEKSRLKVKGSFRLSIYLLQANHPAWFDHYPRYDERHGIKRDMESERQVTLQHENDHFQTDVRFLQLLEGLNRLEGKCFVFCNWKATKLRERFFKLVADRNVHSLSFDSVFLNQGGLYFSHPFKPEGFEWED